jgi:hypothetical protein
MKEKKNQSVSNTKVALVFFAFLIFVVVVSLTIKVINVVKQGKLGDSERYTLCVASGKNTRVISLSSSSKDISIFKLNNDIKLPEVGRFLEIPIDGFISFKSQDLNLNTEALFTKALFDFKNVKTNLTIFDLLKLAISAKSIPENSVNTREIGNIKSSDADKIVGRMVIDDLMEKDYQTIQIINGTQVSGFGSRLARLITNMGGNVILVMTENSPRKKSVITYIDKRTYTVERLQKLLGYDVVKEPSNAMSDVTIIIGEDKINSDPF